MTVRSLAGVSCDVFYGMTRASSRPGIKKAVNPLTLVPSSLQTANSEKLDFAKMSIKHFAPNAASAHYSDSSNVRLTKFLLPPQGHEHYEISWESRTRHRLNAEEVPSDIQPIVDGLKKALDEVSLIFTAVPFRQPVLKLNVLG